MAKLVATLSFSDLSKYRFARMTFDEMLMSSKCQMSRRIAIGLWSDGRKANAGITFAMSFHRHSDRNESGSNARCMADSAR